MSDYSFSTETFGELEVEIVGVGKTRVTTSPPHQFQNLAEYLKKAVHRLTGRSLSTLAVSRSFTLLSFNQKKRRLVVQQS